MKNLSRLTALALVLIGSLAITTSGAAQQTTWVDLDFSQVRLVSGTAAVGDSRTIRLGLQIKMKPGFKTYWRSPGDAGIPPRFDWTGSHNLSNASIAWPAPKRFVLGGFNTFGYADEVVLPIEVELATPGQPLEAHLQVVYGVCRDICVLGDAKLVLTIPEGNAKQITHHDLIEWFDQQVPTTHARDVDISSARIVTADQGPVIEIKAEVSNGSDFDQPDILIEGLEEIALPTPTIVVDTERRHTTVSYQLEKVQPPQNLVGRRVTLTLLDGDHAFEKSVVLSAVE